jgi:hypothetical protein
MHLHDIGAACRELARRPSRQGRRIGAAATSPARTSGEERGLRLYGHSADAK